MQVQSIPTAFGSVRINRGNVFFSIVTHDHAGERIAGRLASDLDEALLVAGRFALSQEGR